MHDEFQETIMAEISELKDGMDAEKLTDILFGLYKSLDGSYMLRLMTSGENGTVFPQAATGIQ
jgi:hypothetical protein